MSSIFLKNSQLTWCIYSTVGDGSSSLRPRVHYTKMSSTRERRRSDPDNNSRDSSSSHIWWRLSLTDSSLTFATVGDGCSSLPSHALPKGLSRERRGRTTPMTTVGILLLSYIWSPD